MLCEEEIREYSTDVVKDSRGEYDSWREIQGNPNHFIYIINIFFHIK